MYVICDAAPTALRRWSNRGFESALRGMCVERTRRVRCECFTSNNSHLWDFYHGPRGGRTKSVFQSACWRVSVIVMAMWEDIVLTSIQARVLEDAMQQRRRSSRLSHAVRFNFRNEYSIQFPLHPSVFGSLWKMTYPFRSISLKKLFTS